MTPQSVPHTDEPLSGIRVLVTRPREDATSLQLGLERLGAEVSHLPTISIRPLTDSVDVTAALDRLGEYDWIAFTSRNAVRTVFDWLGAHHRTMPASVRVAAVGKATAQELGKRGVAADCMPSDSSARALSAALISNGVVDSAVLLPLGNLAGEEMRMELEDAGARVTVISVYETVPAQSADTGAQEALVRGDVDVVALASPSAFRNLLDLTGESGRKALHHARLVAIGPTTADAIRSAGYTTDAVAATQTMEGLVDAIVSLFQVERS